MNIQTKILIFILTLLLAFFSYFFIDYPLAKWINQNLPTEIENIFSYITHIGSGINTIILIIFALILSYILKFIAKKKDTQKLYQQAMILKNQAIILFTAALIGGIVVTLLKFIIGRIRPMFFIEEGLTGFEPFTFGFEFASLPSGHTQTAFTIACCLALFYPKYKIIFFCLAVVVGISRVILLVHYPSDVIIGAYIGIIFSLLVYRQAKLRKYRICNSDFA